MNDDFIDAAFVSCPAASFVGRANECVAPGELGAEKVGEIAGDRVFHGFSREERDAERADIARIGGNDDIGLGLPRDGGGERRRLKRHALAKYGISDRTVSFDAVEIVENDGIVNAGQDFGGSHARRDGFFDDLRHEYGAMLPQADAGLRAEREIGEIGQGLRFFEFSALFFDERSRPSRACFIHGGIDDPAVAEANVFGVLAADFKDRVDVGIDGSRAFGVGGDFVDDIDGLRAEARRKH